MLFKGGLIKGILFGTVIDNIISGGAKLIKSLFSATMKSAGEKGVDEAINYAKSMLDKKERDEQLLSEAKLQLTYTELQAWHDKLAFVDELCKDASGNIKTGRAKSLREYLRRLTIKATIEQTAEEMRFVGGMADEVWESHLRALDLESKYQHPLWDDFRTWTSEKANAAAEKVAENRTEVDDMIAQTADDMRSWANRHFSRP